MKTLQGLPSIKNVWPAHLIKKPSPEIIWKGGSPTDIPAQAKFRIAEGQNNTYPPHVLTQVSRLHAEGITGKGVRIGIIDDGVSFLPESDSSGLTAIG